MVSRQETEGNFYTMTNKKQQEDFLEEVQKVEGEEIFKIMLVDMMKPFLKKNNETGVKIIINGVDMKNI